MSISQIAGAIGQAATLKLNETANRLRKQGEPVINLGGGEPTTKPPAGAIARAAELLETGELRYTPAGGIGELKNAIVQYTETFYQRTVEPGNVIASGGAKQAIMVCLQAILDPGDEVVFPAPYWVSYPEMVRLCGAVPVPVVPEDGTFCPQLQDIERNVTARTKAVIINSPNNPTGAVYSDQFIAEIVAFCEKQSLYLIMDDIYHRLIFDGRTPINCYDHATEGAEDSKLVVVNGVSKQYAMTGFRIGWAVANKKLIEVMTNIQGHQTSGPAGLLQQAAAAAITGDQSGVLNLRQTLESNRDVMMEQLASLRGVKAFRPGGAFYCFADFSALGIGSTELAQFFLDKVRVVTVPGVEFGGEGHLRLSTCGTAEVIVEGISRMKWALDPDGPTELRIGDRTITRDWAWSGTSPLAR